MRSGGGGGVRVRVCGVAAMARRGGGRVRALLAVLKILVLCKRSSNEFQEVERLYLKKLNFTIGKNAK